MKTLLIYDSGFGNTEKIASAIARAFPASAHVQLVKAAQALLPDIQSASLLIFGAPTHGGRPSPAMQQLLDSIPANGLRGKDAAVFDTGIPADSVGLPLRLLIKTIGYAAPKIATSVTTKGARLIVPPENFWVKGKEGPLKEGELERAAVWAKSIITR